MNLLRYSKILVVDDSPFFRSTIKKILHDAQIGSKYYDASDGQEAITKYIAHSPHVTIMDIIMPNVDGVKATMTIRRCDPDAKIIVISAKENRETVQDVVTIGAAQDYVLKPCNSNSIVTAVSKQLLQTN